MSRFGGGDVGEVSCLHRPSCLPQQRSLVAVGATRVRAVVLRVGGAGLVRVGHGRGGVVFAAALRAFGADAAAPLAVAGIVALLQL